MRFMLSLLLLMLVLLPGGSPVLAVNPLDPRFGMAEGWRNPGKLEESAAGTDRVLFSWAALEPNGPESFQPQFYTPSLEALQQEAGQGRELVGMIQFTPAWAARNPDQGERSVPRDLGSSHGPWAQFVRRLADHYKGAIRSWIIWNEPDFLSTDMGFGTWTWGGSEAEYWLLLKDAARAVNEVDPNATIIFGPTTYWVDEGNGRELYLKRVLDVASADPEARPNDWFFDVVAMNIYRAPDDMYRIGAEVDALLASYGLTKPRWITEHNCMPFDDPAVPKPDDGQRCTLEEQAAYTVQAYALGLAGGWSRILWYQLTDNSVAQFQEAWGLVRDDGSERPAFRSYIAVAQLLSHAEHLAFQPLYRDSTPWAAWPEDTGSYYPAWLVYQVIADHGSQRASVLWNASGEPLRVRIPKQGANAVLVDKRGNQHPIGEEDGWYVVDLGPATATGTWDPPGYYYVGGDPLVVVQQGVPLGTEVVEPVLVD